MLQTTFHACGDAEDTNNDESIFTGSGLCKCCFRADGVLKQVNQKKTTEAFDCVRYEVSVCCMEHVSFGMLHGTREFRYVAWNT